MKTLMDRVEEKVELIPFSTCHWWTGATSEKGYGIIRTEGKQKKAHRVAYELYVGEIPEGLQVLHFCDNPPCVNPTHFFLGTNKDNMDDRDRKGRAAKRTGEKNTNSKLTEKDVLKIRASSKSRTELASHFGVSQQNIGYVITRKSWSHTEAIEHGGV